MYVDHILPDVIWSRWARGSVRARGRPCATPEHGRDSGRHGLRG